MNNKQVIDEVRQSSRKLVRELGMLQLFKPNAHKSHQHWHALIEISRDPQLTISKLGKLLVLSTSASSRLVSSLEKDGYIVFQDGNDKRQKCLGLTDKGVSEIGSIDEFSNYRIKGALEFLSDEDMAHIVHALNLYSNALEASRLMRESVNIATLSTSRTIRKQVIDMIETIQTEEFQIPITPDVNAGILKAEGDFYYHNSCNFWYATDEKGAIVGSIGLKKIDDNLAEIKKFFVAPKYRGKGLSRKLMRTLVKAAKKHGFKKLYLGTVARLNAAKRFYTKQGFSTIKKTELPKKFKALSIDTDFFVADVEHIREKLDQL